MNKWTLRQVDKLSKMYFEGKEDKELAKIFNTTERNIYLKEGYLKKREVRGFLNAI
ncbi:hypothetical protein [Clostridium thermobutyricum]|uniref:hypothetical protein n=1 Tax=Clostridium thermobutyricum TaxID=29372 RepID=UPI003F521CC1